MEEKRACPKCGRPMTRTQAASAAAVCENDPTHRYGSAEIGKKCGECGGKLLRQDEPFYNAWDCRHCLGLA